MHATAGTGQDESAIGDMERRSSTLHDHGIDDLRRPLVLVMTPQLNPLQRERSIGMQEKGIRLGSLGTEAEHWVEARAGTKRERYARDANGVDDKRPIAVDFDDVARLGGAHRFRQRGAFVLRAVLAGEEHKRFGL